MLEIAGSGDPGGDWNFYFPKIFMLIYILSGWPLGSAHDINSPHPFGLSLLSGTGGRAYAS